MKVQGKPTSPISSAMLITVGVKTPAMANTPTLTMPVAIVGVAPSGFTGMIRVLAPELWIPVSASLDVEPFGLHDMVPSPTGTSRIERRGERWMFLRGRLKPWASIDRVRANLDLIMSRLAAEYPATNKDRRIAVKATSQVHLHPALDPRITWISRLLLAGVALVFPVFMLMTMMSNGGLGSGVSSSIARAIGAARKDDAEALLFHARVLAVVVGALFSVAVICGGPLLYRALGG